MGVEGAWDWDAPRWPPGNASRAAKWTPYWNATTPLLDNESELANSTTSSVKSSGQVLQVFTLVDHLKFFYPQSSCELFIMSEYVDKALANSDL